MSELIKYKITFPVTKVDITEVYPYPPVHEEDGKMVIPAPQQIRVNDDDLTFSIGLFIPECFEHWRREIHRRDRRRNTHRL